MAEENPSKYLDPRALSKISRLEIKARLIVEGFISGLHRSPYRGYSVEFAEHREYVPGDDIRHIDWAYLFKLRVTPPSLSTPETPRLTHPSAGGARLAAVALPRWGAHASRT